MYQSGSKYNKYHVHIHVPYHVQAHTLCNVYMYKTIVVITIMKYIINFIKVTSSTYWSPVSSNVEEPITKPTFGNLDLFLQSTIY